VRVRIVHIRLDDLPVGAWRELTPKEREKLIAAVGLAEDKGEGRVSARPGRAGATRKGSVLAEPGRAGEKVAS